MKIYVAGSLNMDLTIRAPYAPAKGETLTGDGFMTTPGGKGANQAVAVGKLGGNVSMIGMVGSAFGDELISSLRHANVNTEFVGRTEQASSGIAVIVVVDGDNRIILDRGANGMVSRELIDRALEDAQAGDYFVIQLEISLDMVKYGLEKAKSKGLITVLNPAPAAALDDGIFAACDYFMPNQTEAEFYTGIYPKDEESARECAARLNGKGVKNVVITMGEQGSVGVCGGEYYTAEAVRVDAVDTTAAGDTYVGAFVTALSEGAKTGEAMKFASHASALTVTKRGAQAAIPSRGEVDAFRKDRAGK
ncbi:MAG: ribokinase [Candidatus Gallimonas sp.]